LVNNAGIGAFPALGEITENDLLNVYNTNVFGMALLTQGSCHNLRAKLRQYYKHWRNR
jgi:NAD(P)-dependent dehydrogenase (short-subunit alcohol dehydrogenase family)